LSKQLEKQLPKPNWAEDDALICLHEAVKKTVQELPMFEGNGTILKALADVGSTMYRRERDGDLPSRMDTLSEHSIGMLLIKGFTMRGALIDRAVAVKSYMEILYATRLSQPLGEIAQVHQSATSRVDELQKELEEEPREPGDAVPKRYRGKGGSAAEELLAATLDLWATSIQFCRREVEEEGDLEPPESQELQAFIQSCLLEFAAGSLGMRLNIVRYWKHVFAHLSEQRLPLHDTLGNEICQRVVASLQSASLDQRSERLRRPALELSAALIKDSASGGGRALILTGLSPSALSGSTVLSLQTWIDRIDQVTADQCTADVAILRSALEET